MSILKEKADMITIDVIKRLAANELGRQLKAHGFEVDYYNKKFAFFRACLLSSPITLLVAALMWLTTYNQHLFNICVVLGAGLNFVVIYAIGYSIPRRKRAFAPAWRHELRISRETTRVMIVFTKKEAFITYDDDYIYSSAPLEVLRKKGIASCEYANPKFFELMVKYCSEHTIKNTNVVSAYKLST